MGSALNKYSSFGKEIILRRFSLPIKDRVKLFHANTSDCRVLIYFLMLMLYSLESTPRYVNDCDCQQRGIEWYDKGREGTGSEKCLRFVNIDFIAEQEPFAFYFLQEGLEGYWLEVEKKQQVIHEGS